jgi:hypothetical protein
VDDGARRADRAAFAGALDAEFVRLGTSRLVTNIAGRSSARGMA